MGLLETLKSGYDALNSGKKTAGAPEEGGLFSVIMGLAGDGKKPEIAGEAEEKREAYAKERGSFFGELAKSLLLRQMPRLSALTDIGLQLSGKKSVEKVAWQNEFETITALLILVPNSWKHHITDLFASNSVFQAIVKHWPGLDGADVPIIGSTGLLSKVLPALGEGGSLRARILDRQPPDPDAVIQVLRIIHQDVFVSGKMSFDKLKEMIGDATKTALTVGGGAALAAGAAKALGVGGGESTVDKAVDTVKATLGLSSDKKIIDIISANPAGERTSMQKNLLKLLDQLKVKDTAVLKKGSWEGNNDEVTVEFKHNGKSLFMIFDNDISSTDIKVNNSEGTEIVDFTDMGSFDADDAAKKITEAIEKNSPNPSK